MSESSTENSEGITVPWEWHVHAPFLRECRTCNINGVPEPLMYPQTHLTEINACVDDILVPLIQALHKAKIPTEASRSNLQQLFQVDLRPEPDYGMETAEQKTTREQIQQQLKNEAYTIKRSWIRIRNPKDNDKCVALFIKWLKKSGCAVQAEHLKHTWETNRSLGTNGTPETEGAVTAELSEKGTVIIKWWGSWTSYMTAGATGKPV